MTEELDAAMADLDKKLLELGYEGRPSPIPAEPEQFIYFAKFIPENKFVFRPPRPLSDEQRARRKEKNKRRARRKEKNKRRAASRFRARELRRNASASVLAPTVLPVLAAGLGPVSPGPEADYLAAISETARS